MKYVGSKRRIAKSILPIILRYRRPGQCYVEPFVGGFNLIDKVGGWRIGNDSHHYLIELFKALQQGWIPPNMITEDMYKLIASDMDSFHPRLVGFVGFNCTFGAGWMGGYARSKGKDRNYAAEGRNKLLRQVESIRDVQLFNKSYDAFPIPKHSLIYCDPPYATTKIYGGVSKFESARFWEWATKQSKNGHDVFVSELNAPADWECIWTQPITINLDSRTPATKQYEKLFVYRDSDIAKKLSTDSVDN